MGREFSMGRGEPLPNPRFVQRARLPRQVSDNAIALRAGPVLKPAILVRIPAGRWGEPDGFKGAAGYLASRASDYVSGEIPVVEGGR